MTDPDPDFIRWRYGDDAPLPYYVHTTFGPDKDDTMSIDDRYRVEIHRTGTDEWTWRVVHNTTSMVTARAETAFTVHSLAHRNAAALFPTLELVDVE